MKSFVGFLLTCAAVAMVAVLVWFVGRTTVPDTAVQPNTAHQVASLGTDAPSPALPPAAALEPEPDRREAASAPAEEADDASSVVVAPAVESPPETLDTTYEQLLSDRRARIITLEAEIDRLTAELDECRNGVYSVLGALHALPEWAALDRPQRAIILDFLRAFPVRLSPGEAVLIATHASPTGDTTAELIAMLGRSRVFNSMPPEAREKLLAEDPEAFRSYFGSLALR